MKTSLVLAIALVSAACGRAEQVSKRDYQEDLAVSWTTGCKIAENDGSERHSLALKKDDSFAFTTRRFEDADCQTEALQISYNGFYSIGGSVLRQGMSGRTVTMNVASEATSPATDGVSGPFEPGSTHRAVFLVGGDGGDELTEYDRDGDVIRRYSKD